MSEQRVERLVRAPAPQRLAASRVASLLAVVCLLVALVAAASPRSLARVGGSPPGSHLSAAIGDLLLIVFALATVAFALVAYLTWLGRVRRRKDDEPEPVLEHSQMHWRLKLLLLLVALAVLGVPLAVIGFLARRNEGPQPLPPVLRGPGTLSPHPSGRAGHPELLTFHWPVLVGVGVLALVALGAVLFVTSRSRRVETTEPETTVEELLDAVEESLEELEREPDPRRAVIKAYARMERVLAAHELARRTFEAPVEYLTRALVALRGSGASAKRLTVLFERARFSRHTVDHEMKREAIDALVALRADLEAGQ